MCFSYGIGQPGIFRGKVIPVQHGVPTGTEHNTASHIPDGTVGEIVHILLVEIEQVARRGNMSGRRTLRAHGVLVGLTIVI